MKKKRIFVLFILIYFLTVNLSLAELANKILAVVNDEVITYQELKDVLLPLYAQYQATYKGKELEEMMAEAERDMLNQLIEDRLILQEARKQNIVVNDDEVQEKIGKLKQQFSSPEEFTAVIKQQNINLKKLEELYREQLMIKELINRQVRLRVVVDPQQVTDYYHLHLQDFKDPESVRVSNILVRTRDRLDSEAKVQAKEILKLLKEGADFSQLAQEHSQGPGAADGGDMGFVFKGQLLPEIDQEIFKLNPGQTSDLVKSDLGYHIFRVEEKRAEEIKLLDTVKAQIHEILFKQKFEEIFSEWMGKLKKHAYIVIK